MRAGTDTALVRVVAVFGTAKPHCVYLFAKRRANRMKVLVHDGVGIWLAAWRLHQRRFFWPGMRQGSEVELDTEQLQICVLVADTLKLATEGKYCPAERLLNAEETAGKQSSDCC